MLFDFSFVDALALLILALVNIPFIFIILEHASQALDLTRMQETTKQMEHQSRIKVIFNNFNSNLLINSLKSVCM